MKMKRKTEQIGMIQLMGITVLFYSVESIKQSLNIVNKLFMNSDLLINKLIQNKVQNQQMKSVQDEKQKQFIETNFKLERQHEDQMPYSIERQVDCLVSNIKYYVCILISKSASIEQIAEIKNNLIIQLELINSDYVHTQKIQKLDEILPINNADIFQRQFQWNEGFIKIEEFGQTIKKFMLLKADTVDEEEFQNFNESVKILLKQMQIIVIKDKQTIRLLERYQVHQNNFQSSVSSNEKQVQKLPPDHYRKQKIIFSPCLHPQVFKQVDPPRHKDYLSKVTQVYHDIVPYKIKYVCPNSHDEPKIEVSNYFNQDIDPQKAVVHYCKPGTKTLVTYRLDDICKLHTIEKQYAIEKQLNNNWVFTPYAKTVITPDGRIFGINCRTTDNKQDSSLYEITSEKASNRGRILEPRKNSGFTYCNKCIYVIGGNGEKEKCSAKNFKYSLRQKKWIQIADSNVPLRKPTICSYKDRYIFKIGGINQFDYVNKVIEMYDTTTDRWSVVRANPKSILEEVQILQDSLAVQIGEDQIYVFAGKNANNYQADTGLVLQIMEIRQKIKAPAKVSGQLWNVSIGKKNILSFFGLFSPSNVITFGNCLYPMRSETCKLQRF